MIAGNGGAGRASLDPLEGAFLNPAALTQLDSYHMGVYMNDSGDVSSGQQRDWAVLIADSTPDKILPAALAFTKRRITRGDSPAIDQRDYYVAVADRVVSNLSLGIGFHRLESDIGGEDHNQNNVHASLLFTPLEHMGFALVGYDLLGPSSSVPSDVSLKRTVATGITYVYENFIQFRFDWALVLKDNPDHKSKFMLGIDSALHSLFSLRVGAQKDDLAEQTFASVGCSFNGPRLAFDYAFQKEVDPGDGGYRHLVDVRLKF